MDLQSILSVLTKQGTVDNISKATGESPNAVQQIIENGLPLILGQIGKNTTTTDGASSLNSALDQHSDDSILDTLSGIFGDNDGDGNADGLKILGKVFGGSSETAATHVAEKTGTSSVNVTKILSFVAPLVLAYLAKQRSSGTDVAKSTQETTDSDGNPLIDLVGSVLGGSSSSSGGVLGNILGGLFGKK